MIIRGAAVTGLLSIALDPVSLCKGSGEEQKY